VGLLSPQIPAVTCALLLVCVLVAAAAVFRAIVPQPAAWQQLLVQTGAGALFYALFVVFNPFTAVRDVVTETADDMLPPGLRQALTWGRQVSRT
jgi:hypothetical protein